MKRICWEELNALFQTFAERYPATRRLVERDTCQSYEGSRTAQDAETSKNVFLDNALDALEQNDALATMTSLLMARAARDVARKRAHEERKTHSQEWRATP